MEREPMAGCQLREAQDETSSITDTMTTRNMPPHVYLLKKQILKTWAKNLCRSLWPEKFSQANSEWKQQRTWTTDGESEAG